jgi:hypothetical protein
MPTALRTVRLRRTLVLAAVAAAAITVVGPQPALHAVPSAVVDDRVLPVGAPRESGLHAFRLAGVSWAGGGVDVDGRIRFHSAAGWSSWRTLHGDGDEGPDTTSHEARRARTVSDPVWAGQADGYQLDVPPGLRDVRVHLVRDTTRWVASAAPAPAHAATAQPDINPRSAWGARPPKVAPSYAPSVKMAFVHHTVNNNTYSAADVPAMLRAIQTYHMDTQGWDDIGYNFIVDRFGHVWEARAGGTDRAVIGAHAAGFNTGSTGVSVLGDFSTEAPSSAAVAAVGRLLGWKLPLHGVDPRGSNVFTSGGSNKYPEGTRVTLANISGHKDVGETACPARLYDQLGQIRVDAAGWAGSATAYPGFGGGLYVAGASFGGSATPGFVTGAGATGGPHVRTFDRTGAPRSSFFAYAPNFTGGVRVATGNIDGVPGDEIIVAPGPGGGPHVRVLREDGSEVLSFNAYGSFTGGVFVAAGNVDGVPGDEIITGADAGAGSHLRVFNALGIPIADFSAYGPAFRGGVRVATADVDGDGIDEIVTGAGPGGGPHVRILRLSGEEVAGFYAYSPQFGSGVYVGSVPGPGNTDWLVTGPGEGGGPHVRVFDKSVVRNEFLTDPVGNTSGIRVSGGLMTGSRPGQLVLGFGPGAMPIVRLTDLAGELRLY